MRSGSAGGRRKWVADLQLTKEDKGQIVVIDQEASPDIEYQRSRLIAGP